MAGTTGDNIRNHAAFIWSVADLLRGDYKQSEYGRVILPLVVLRRLDRVEYEMLSLGNEIKAMKAGLSGTLSIGVGQFWLGRIVPSVVAKLLATAPEVQTRIVTGNRDELLGLLQRGKLDLVLGRITGDLPDGLVGEALGDVRLYLTVRDGHPLAALDAGELYAIRIATTAKDLGGLVDGELDPGAFAGAGQGDVEALLVKKRGLRLCPAGARDRRLHQLEVQRAVVGAYEEAVAVMGDGRRYDYVIALRAVETIDFMTARWSRLPLRCCRKYGFGW